MQYSGLVHISFRILYIYFAATCARAFCAILEVEILASQPPALPLSGIAKTIFVTTTFVFVSS